MTMLEDIVNATLDENVNFVYTSEKERAKWLRDGLVEINSEIVDDNGRVATRATTKGIELVKNNYREINIVKVAPMEVVIEDGIKLPGKIRSADCKKFPFNEMEVGQSFFIAATEEVPDPAVKYSSAVSNATRRNSYPQEDGATRKTRKGKVVPVMIETKKFVIRSVDGGARIWRAK